jgi:hypothetical protein
MAFNLRLLHACSRQKRSSHVDGEMSHISEELRTTYQVCVRRGWETDMDEIYPVPLRQRLPVIRILLRQAYDDARLDLQAVIDQAYRNGRYHTINYRVAPEPPLFGPDALWADQLLQRAGKR